MAAGARRGSGRQKGSPARQRNSSLLVSARQLQALVRRRQRGGESSGSAAASCQDRLKQRHERKEHQKGHEYYPNQRFRKGKVSTRKRARGTDECPEDRERHQKTPRQYPTEYGTAEIPHEQAVGGCEPERNEISPM